jgi:DNA-directed RNA polymerase specialized sigma24 family protein
VRETAAAKTDRMTIRQIIDAARRHARRGDVLPLICLEHHPADRSATVSAHDARIALIVTHHWLRSSARRDRLAVLLSLSGYGGSEIAEAIGCSETAARQVVSRAMRRLRVELEDPC